ncbi:putative chitinase [Helianthus anomalus]
MHNPTHLIKQTNKQTTMKTFGILIIIGVLLAGIPNSIAQNCGCSPDLCCSQYGFCGLGEEYCGTGCRGDAFFSGIVDQSDASCDGRGFYTRAAFLEALRHYPEFSRVGSEEDSRKEIAAFFAHVTHETGHFCYVEAINGSSGDYCEEENTEYSCNPDKDYYGRGPIQLSWNFNYGPAGISIGFDGLNNPEIVATDPVISF